MGRKTRPCNLLQPLEVVHKLSPIIPIKTTYHKTEIKPKFLPCSKAMHYHRGRWERVKYLSTIGGGAQAPLLQLVATFGKSNMPQDKDKT